MALPFEKTQQAIVLRVYLTPHSRKERLAGFIVDARGEMYLKAYVHAVPEDNKANVALVKLIAKSFAIAVSCVEIISGFQSRRKKVLLQRVSEEHVLTVIESCKAAS